MRPVRAFASPVRAFACAAVAVAAALAVVPSRASTGGAGAPALLEPQGGYGPHAAGTELALVRREVISAALSMVGQVSDKGGQNGDKLGWEHLKAFFDEGSEWGPDCFQKGRAVEDGIKLAGRNPPGGEWCGIFGTWCFVQAGVHAKWKFGVGPAPLQAHSDVANVQPGDMGVIPHFVHHFVVVRRDGDQVWTVSGNSYFHAVALDSPRKVSSLCYYYRPCPEVWVAAPAPAPSPSPAASPTPAPSPASRPLLRRGDKGAAVERLQRDLVAAGESVTVDGDFGPGTEKAVKAFQKAHGCAVDGIVGARTWAALEPGNP